MQWYKGLIIPALFLIGSCDKVESILPIQPPEEGETTTFVIPEGKHRSQDEIQIFDGNSLAFKVRFNESAIYSTENRNNQADINKLYGFSDCGTHHHENSARIGWRWFKDQLELHAYTYINGQRITQFIKAIPLNTYADCEIMVEDNLFVYKVDDKEVKIGRPCSLDPGGYRLFPYFGGDEVAPQEITIDILQQ